MELNLQTMTLAAANAIRSWRYPPPYDFYDLDADPDDLAEFFDDREWPGAYYAALDHFGDLVGFFIFDRKGRTATVGLGMRPDLTGRGLGTQFVAAGLEYGAQELGIESYIVEVATFNHRAINVYRRLRFRPREEFQQSTNGGGVHSFVRMVGPAVRRGTGVLMVDGDGRVALQLRDAKPSIGGGDCWGIFGGGMRPGETPEQILRREMREELCIDLDISRLYLVKELVTPVRLRSHVFVYELRDELAGACLQEGQRFGLYASHDVADSRIEGKLVIPYHLTVLEEYWAGEFRDRLA